MAFSVTEFQGQMQFGGARPSLFECNITNPFNSSADDKIRFMCRTAQIPSSTIGVIPVSYFGRPVKFAGNRTFEPWTVTIINDTDFGIRSAFEKWMNVINKMDNATGLTDPAAYHKDAVVHQLDRDGSVLRSYKFWDVFPTNISAIDVSYETGDTIEEFTVELQVHWWEAYKGPSAKAGGEDIS